MRVLQINQNYGFGSTGKIVKELGQVVEEQGGKSFFLCAYTNCDNDNLLCLEHGSLWFNTRKNILMPRLTGRTGYRQRRKTLRYLDYVKKWNPDIIHLHNIHGDWIHLETLFTFLKESKLPVVWTLHDCWSFTGRCSHFEYSGCYKWREGGCFSCKNKSTYPITYFFDFSKKMFRDKMNLFTSLPKVELITPSEWLANYVRQSFLGCYQVNVINNGIDTNVFKPSSGNFREKYSCTNKFIILGVSSGWRKRKGLDVFVELAKRLEPERFQIVLVGTTRKVDTVLPDNIISIHRTENQRELAEIYSCANLFVNPTREEVFSLVTAEALACGTPAVIFRTGGVPEIVDSSSGVIVEKDDVDGMTREIINLAETPRFSREKCRERASKFDCSVKYREYLALYDRQTRL